MTSRKDEKVYPGNRPPPNRTYGSKYRPGRVGRLDHDELRTIPNSPLGGTHRPENKVHRRNLTLPTGRMGRGSRRINAAGAREITSQSAEDISRLVHSAGEGGQGGRAAAVTLAQACKSIDTRKCIGVDGGKYVLDELSSVTRNMLQGGGGQQQRDEAILHCLIVALYTLSKDRALVLRFDASIFSTLAFLIESCGRRDAEKPSNHTIAIEADSMQSLSVSPNGQEKKPTGSGSTRLLGELQERRVPASHLRTSLEGPQLGNGLNNSGVGNNDEIDARDFGGGEGRARSSLSGGNLENEQNTPYSQGANHGAAGIMVRARMLLDITDILPWGLANRHLVSAADLGLATMLNVVGRGSPEGEAAEAPNGSGAGDSLEDEFSTQGSAVSRCDSVALSADGRSDNGKAATRPDVLLELSRLSRSGFFVSLVVDGARDLERLAASRRGASRGIAVDPSSLRELHRLHLALRLLDLATLENSPGKDATALDSNVDAAKPYQDSELAGALLCVVSRCQGVKSGSASARRNGEHAVAGEMAGRGGHRTRYPTISQEQPVVDEVGSRVHECLLAALRVLVNLTHEDAKVCAVVGEQGGLETLMHCLVAHSDCELQESDEDVSPLSRYGRLDSGTSFGRTTVGERQSPGAGVSMDDVDDGAGRSRRAGGGFDAQILSMGALINCVELQESADNCAAMGTLAISPPTEPLAEPGRGRGRDLGRGQVRGPPRTRAFLAPEFLGRLLVFCTRSFARHLEINRASDEDEAESSDSPSVPSKDRNDRNKDWISTRDEDHMRGKNGSTAQLAAPLVCPSAPAVNVRGNCGGKMEQHQHHQRQEEDDDEEMSHAEGADLVLGGHCALLLGLLIRGQEEIRRLALSVLPERTATLIVRVLEAFMALQYQAGVLTEEVALKVQSLVEDLEGVDGLPIPDEESDDPFELDSEDEIPSISIPATASKTEVPPRRKGRKRPRCSRNTPPPHGTFSMPLGKFSGQWATDTGGDDCADGFSLSANCPGSIAREGRVLPSWLPQAKANATASSSSSSAFVSDDRTSPWNEKLPPCPPATKEGDTRSEDDASKTRDNANTDTGNARLLDRPSPGYARRTFGVRGAGWRIGTAASGKLGLGRGGGGTALGTRTWLGGSPPRVYGRNPSIYGSQALPKSSGGSLSEISSSLDPGAVRASGGMGECRSNGADQTNVFGMMSDDTSDDDLPRVGISVAGGVGRREGGTCAGLDIGPASGNISAAPMNTKSIFDLDGFSSDESPLKPIPSSLARKFYRATKSLATGDHTTDAPRAAGGSKEGSASNLSRAFSDARAPAYDGLNERARRDKSPPRAKEGGRPEIAARGVGPRNRRASMGRGAPRAPPGAPRSSKDTNIAGVVKRTAVSQYRRRMSESSAHAHGNRQDDSRPPICTLAPVRAHAPEKGDGKDVAPQRKRQRAESFAAVVGPRGRIAHDGKGKVHGVMSNNVFEMFDSDGDDAGVGRSSVFDIGDDSE